MNGPFTQITPRSFLEGRETILAAILSLVWIVVLAAYGAGYFGLLGDMGQPRDAVFLEVVFFLIVLILPLSMVWLVSSIIRRSFEIQDEARRLEQQVRELQGSGSAHSRVSQPRVKDPRIEMALKNVNELNERIRYLESQVVSDRQTVESPPQDLTISQAPPEQRPADTVEEPQTASPEAQRIQRHTTASNGASGPEDDLVWADALRALNFPNNESDAEGFRTLRMAKRNTEIGPLLRASEDILTLLAQEGIYMEDMRPTIAPAGVWRMFAHGERGGEVSEIGGIEAPEAIIRIKARHDSDQIFRDTKLHFLRRFEIVLRAFADSADNSQIQQLADTRTGRAFMLLALASDII